VNSRETDFIYREGGLCKGYYPRKRIFFVIQTTKGVLSEMLFLGVIFKRALRSNIDCRIETFEPAFGVGLNCIKRNVLILLGMAMVFLPVKIGPIGL
jgi:hypothetical protein